MLETDVTHELRALLAKLATARGDATTTTDVAELLRAELATGGSRRPGACPVARYLERAGADVAPAVLPFAVFVYRPPDAKFSLVRLSLPPVVAAFVREFDSGRYDDLRGTP